MTDGVRDAMFERSAELKAAVSGASAIAVTESSREAVVEKFNRENCSYYYLFGSQPNVVGGAAVATGSTGLVVQRAYYQGPMLRVSAFGGNRGDSILAGGRGYNTGAQKIAAGNTVDDAKARMPLDTDRNSGSIVVVSRGASFDASTKGQGDIQHAVPPMPILVGTLLTDIGDADTEVSMAVYIVGEHWLPEPVNYVIPVASRMTVSSLSADKAKSDDAVAQAAFGAASSNLGIGAPDADSLDGDALVAFHGAGVVDAFAANEVYADVMKGPVLRPHDPANGVTVADYTDAVTALTGAVTQGSSSLGAVVLALTQVRARFTDGDVPDAGPAIASAEAQHAAAATAALAGGVTPATLVPAATFYPALVDAVAEGALARAGNQQTDLIRLQEENAHLRGVIAEGHGSQPHTHPTGPYVPSVGPPSGGIPSRVSARRRVDPLKAQLRQLLRTGASNAEIDALISEIDRLNRVANA